MRRETQRWSQESGPGLKACALLSIPLAFGLRAPGLQSSPSEGGSATADCAHWYSWAAYRTRTSNTQSPFLVPKANTTEKRLDVSTKIAGPSPAPMGWAGDGIHDLYKIRFSLTHRRHLWEVSGHECGAPLHSSAMTDACDIGKMRLQQAPHCSCEQSCDYPASSSDIRTAWKT